MSQTTGIILGVVLGSIGIVTIICLSIVAGTTNRTIIPNRNERRLKKAQTDLAIKHIERDSRTVDLAMTGVDGQIKKLELEHLQLTAGGNNSHPEDEEYVKNPEIVKE